jgi:homoserine dehydrogenase
MADIAVLGYGVVGSGVLEVINKNSISISRKAGESITVKKVLDIRSFPDDPYRDIITKNADEVFDDPSISIIVETIGGTGIAYEYTKKAFSKGKNVVTSNKELVAAHGPELLQLAKDAGVNYLFEASVGGGIPIIRPLNQCLAANEITGIAGILNGTTNYILTQMKKEGKSFDEALKNAQKNGYAEANPTADIEGHDACRKIAILSSIAYNEFVDYRNIHTEGISHISLVDMEYAEKLNCVIKLIALSRKAEGKIYARVSPAFISKSSSLSSVEDVFNAIVVKGDAIGEVMFYGRGAGKLPTASAVVADVIDIAKHDGSVVRTVWQRKDLNNILDFEKSECLFFVRLETRNRAEAKKLILNRFGDVDFVKLDDPDLEGEIAFITKTMAEGEFSWKLDSLKGRGSVKAVVNVIRMEEE